jgi:hypothetical protein
MQNQRENVKVFVYQKMIAESLLKYKTEIIVGLFR